MASNLFSSFTRKKRFSLTSSGDAGTKVLTSSINQNNASVNGEENGTGYMEPSSIRLVIFMESESRKLLYDSKSLPSLLQQSMGSPSSETSTRQKGRLRASSSAASVTSEASSAPSVKAQPSVTARDMRPQPDTKQLCEMIFGSMNMVYHGCTIKIHPNIGANSHSQQNYMISYLSQFTFEAAKQRISEEAIATATANVPNRSSNVTPTTPTAVSPTRRYTTGPYQLDGSVLWNYEDGPHRFSDDDDDSFTSNNESSDADEAPPPANQGKSQRRAWNKLYIQPVGSFVGGQSVPTPAALLRRNTSSTTSLSSLRGGTASSAASNVSSVSKQLWQTCIPPFYAASNDLTDVSTMRNTTIGGSRRTRMKLGIAMVLPGNMIGPHNTSQFVQSHMAIIEGYLENMKRVVESAMLDKTTFLSTVHNAFIQLRQRLIKLVCDRRVMLPTWIALHSPCSIGVVTDSYLTVLSQLSSKQMKYLAQLLTCVLTHHLAWVTSVCGGMDNDVIESTKSTRVNCRWIQLCDLFGIASTPTRSVRIVVSGSNFNSIEKMLVLLSYFIRAGALSKRYFAVPALVNSTQQSFSAIQQLPVQFCSLESSSDFETVCPVDHHVCENSVAGGEEAGLPGRVDQPVTPVCSRVREAFQSSMATDVGSGSSASTIQPDKHQQQSKLSIGIASTTVASVINTRQHNRKQSDTAIPAAAEDICLKQSLSPDFSDFRVDSKRLGVLAGYQDGDTISPLQHSTKVDINSSVHHWMQQAQYAPPPSLSMLSDSTDEAVIAETALPGEEIVADERALSPLEPLPPSVCIQTTVTMSTDDTGEYGQRNISILDADSKLANDNDKDRATNDDAHPTSATTNAPAGVGGCSGSEHNTESGSMSPTVAIITTTGPTTEVHVSHSTCSSSHSSVHERSNGASATEVLQLTPLNLDNGLVDLTASSSSSLSFALCTSDTEEQQSAMDVPYDVLAKYIHVPFAKHERLCAPSSVVCTTSATSIAHSLTGVLNRVSTSGGVGATSSAGVVDSGLCSSDAMLQGCQSNNISRLNSALLAQSHHNFIVDSKPIIIIADLDKLSVCVVQDGVERMLPRNEAPSKTVEGCLEKASMLYKLGMKKHCCLNVIERTLRSLVSKSVALTAALITDDKSLLQSISIAPSDVALMKAVATCVQSINNQD